MVTDNVKKLLGLTDYQRQRVEEFLEAAKRMQNAGVYSFSNHHNDSVYFVNYMNVKGFFIGEDGCTPPFTNDHEVIDQLDIQKCGGIETSMTNVFDNYAFPEDYLMFELKDEEQ